MFVGHYSVSLVAKAVEPRAPLWTYVLAAQLIDIGWAGLVAAGVEKVRVDRSLPGSPLDLYHMPWTHSLPGALAWSLAGGILAKLVLKVPTRAAVFVGAVVFSHWLLDLLVHRPDLELWLGGPKVGCGLWNYPVPEQAVEIGLLAVGGAWWIGQRVREGRHVWPAAIFLAGLVGLQILGMLLPPGGDRVQMGLTALLSYLVVAFAAWLVDRRSVDAAERLPATASRA